MVGIWGMGGAGKTTIAKHIFNKRSLTFGRSCFVSDVREAARKEALHDKQKELLKGLDLGTIDFNNVDTGKEILRGRLKSVPVLIVLDDIDHRDQLDALVPDRDSLGKGSLIIVTTRELRVLKAWGISVIYKIRALNTAHAKELFCWHAFEQPSPLLGFENLAEKFVDACHGLPLSLKVFGGLFCGESDKNYWESQLDKVSRRVPNDIKLRLRISYDALDEEEKEMFLDVACFFIGKRSSVAIAVWDGSDWNGLHGWQRITLLKTIKLRECHNCNKIEGIGPLRLLETMIIHDCTEFKTLPNLAGLTSLKKLELKRSYKLEKIIGLESLRSLEKLRIEDCPELDTLPSLVKLTLLEEINLDKLEVNARLKPPCGVNLEQQGRLMSLMVTVNDLSVVESLITKIQTMPNEVITCTRVAIDVGSLKNFFTCYPLKNVVEFTSYGGLKLRRPQYADDANAILICFIIDSLYPKIHFHINADTGGSFDAVLCSGKWVWMGVFPVKVV